jgi:hypothetical protein
VRWSSGFTGAGLPSIDQQAGMNIKPALRSIKRQCTVAFVDTKALASRSDYAFLMHLVMVTGDSPLSNYIGQVLVALDQLDSMCFLY